MPKLKQNPKKMFETPQIVPNTLSTEMYGGDSPDKKDIIRSVNARAQKRHEMKKQHLADEEVLPDSAEILGNEMVGIRDNEYLVKKELEFGVNAFYNTLPPGMDIEDQEVSDIREMEMRVYDQGLGYPGDGWVHRPLGSQMPGVKDLGRPGKTNYKG